MLPLRRWCDHGDGQGRGGSGGRTRGKIQQQLTLGVVDVQGLGAALSAARLLASLEAVLKSSVSRSESVSCRRGRGLGEDAWGEFDCVWNDGVAALQRVPEGGGGGFRCRRSAAGHRGEGVGAGRGDVKTWGFKAESQI